MSTAVDLSTIHRNAFFPGRSVASSDVFLFVAPHGCLCPERFTRLLGAGGSGLLRGCLLRLCLLRCCLLGKVL